MQITEVDRIGRVRAQWAHEEPGLDTVPMEVIGRILRVAHLADARIRTVLREEGLDRGGLDVLATLRRSGRPYRLTPTRLYQELVGLTGRGRELAGQAMAAHMRCEAAMTRLLPPAEREALAELLARLLTQMEEEQI
jgi:hypothetical protein